ncbi:hypothetical protein Tco_0184773 [Tanacetum coccineum]
MVVLSEIHISEGSFIDLSYNKPDQPLQLHGTGVNTVHLSGSAAAAELNVTRQYQGQECAVLYNVGRSEKGSIISEHMQCGYMVVNMKMGAVVEEDMSSMEAVWSNQCSICDENLIYE